MLTSITPLGERGRGNRWGVTTTALIVGCLVAGGGAGALAGGLGALALGGVGIEARLALVAAGLAVGLALDLGWGGTRLPTIRRQVNEDWLRAYRGWVYGLGFGLQLGVGAATIVGASAIYATFLCSFAAASVGAGALIGAVFGTVRGASVLAGRGVRGPAELVELGRRLRRWEAPARRLGLLAQGALAILALAAAVVA
jgi:hypothetical protein